MRTRSHLLVVALILVLCPSVVVPQKRSGRRQIQRPARATKQTTPQSQIQIIELDTPLVPARYQGANPSKVYMSLLPHREALKKGQFETEDAYLARLQALLGKIKIDGQLLASDRVSFATSDFEGFYDADSKQYTIKADLRSEAALSILDKQQAESSGFYGRRTDRYLFSDPLTSLLISSVNTTIGTRVGQNAFGVRKRYSIKRYRNLQLVMPERKLMPLYQGWIIKDIAPDKARQLMRDVSVVLTGRLMLPIISQQYDSYEATISEPEESHVFSHSLYFDPDALVLYRLSTGEVIATIDLERSVQKFSPTSVVSPSIKTDKPKVEIKKAVIHFRPEPSITAEALMNNVSGTVRLRVELGAEGQIGEIEVLKGLPYSLTERAIESAKRIRFTPAKENGIAVSQIITIEYEFNSY
jgi:TonB family protein